MRLVLLVAGRELHETFRSRAYWLTMGLLLAALAAVMVLPRVFDSDAAWELGVAGEVPAGLEEDVAGAALAFEAEVELVPLADRAAAEEAVAGEEVDAALVFGGDGTAFLLRATTSDTLVSLATQAATGVAVRERLVEAGLAPAAVAEALSAPPPEEVHVDGERPARSAVAYAVSFVLYLALITGGIAVATGVGVEKSSRIAEVLVTTLRPWQLLAGKVLGIGTSSLLLLLTGAVPFALAVLTGFLDLPQAAVGDVLGGLGWFVLGFAIYATAFAALGALVDRQEDVSGAVAPLTTVLILAVFAALQAQSSPHSLVAQVTSLFPLTAPIVMPMRIAQGAAGPFEVGAAVVLGLLTLLLFARVGSIVYRRALLRGGRKLGLAEVLRG